LAAGGIGSFEEESADASAHSMEANASTEIAGTTTRKVFFTHFP
jgi:hypothetical protein